MPSHFVAGVAARKLSVWCTTTAPTYLLHWPQPIGGGIGVGHALHSDWHNTYCSRLESLQAIGIDISTAGPGTTPTARDSDTSTVTSTGM
eukprot:1118110-Rhodomonas_salina.1